MELIPCPSCGLPRHAADTDAPCAVCGRRFADGPAPVEDALPSLVEAPVELAPASPPREPGMTQNWLLLGAMVLAGLGVAAAMLWEPWAEPPAADTVVLRPPSNPPPSPKVDATLPAGPEPAPEPRVHVPSIAVLPPAPAAPVEPELAPLPRVWVAANAVAVIRLNRPNETYQLSRVGERNHIRLVGIVQKLVVDGVGDGATLDASELVAKDVSFSGKIDGGSTVKVRSENGSVSFRHKVDGAAQVTVRAGTGYVAFANPTQPNQEGSKIDGNSRVWITAKTVVLVGVIGGADTRVHVTLATGGSLRFQEVTGAAKLHYRQGDPTDPPPRITPGTVRGKAECKAVE